VPDVYGGDELPYLALVDPDNRRPVDWEAGRSALASPPTADTVKLHLIREALALRQRRPEAFAGAYVPLAAGEGTCAYRRGDDVAVAVSVRGGEPEVELPPGRWHDVLAHLEPALGGAGLRLLERA
jgi:(1->4)-alpha-D-glucan 1-alpha-D-glucosylmutase